MTRIKEEKETREIKPVNGILSNDTMEVGKSGVTIDEDVSYEKMKKLDEYNENLLEYIFTKPLITKKNNLEKQITGKVTNEKEISIVFEVENLDNLEEINYILKSNNTKVTFFIDGKTIENNLLYLKQNLLKNTSLGLLGYANNYNETSLRYTKGLIEKHFSLTEYCLYKNEEFLESCKTFKINTIKPQKIEKYLYSHLKQNIENGKIYQISINNSNIKQLNTTFKYLKQKGYTIKTLEDLLKE